MKNPLGFDIINKTRKREKKNMLRMTGNGKGEYKENGLEIVCEIKTVNNRYLDLSVKAPRILSGI